MPSYTNGVKGTNSGWMHPTERRRIIDLFAKNTPINEVHRITGRSFLTLTKIRDATA